MRPPLLFIFHLGIFLEKLLGVAWDGLAHDGAVVVSWLSGEHLDCEFWSVPDYVERVYCGELPKEGTS